MFATQMSTHTRTTMNKTKSLMLGGTLMAALTLSSLGAGPLTPPGTPGQPVADMPSLIEIKAAIDALAAGGGGLNGRTAIPAQTATYTIGSPGSYVLTGNISAGSGDGIVISSSHVTLDLNGFNIYSNYPAGRLGTAIRIGPGVRGVTVKNGHLLGSSLSGFASGIIIDWTGADSDGLVFEDLSLSELGVGLSGAGSSDHGAHNIVLRRLNVTNGTVLLRNTVVPPVAAPYDARYGTAIECQVTADSSATVALDIAHAINCTAHVGLGTPIHANVQVGCLPAAP